MKHLTLALLLITLILTLVDCKNEKKEELYIISKQDSIWEAYKLAAKSNDTLTTPVPTIPFIRYSGLAFIFDSTDMIYLCQTRRKINSDAFENRDKDILNNMHPNFIGFYPEDFIAIKSNYFMQFIKDNIDNFPFDSCTNNSEMVVYLACMQDTITNQSFYDLYNLIKKRKSSKNPIRYNIRKTTEEEYNVIFYKKRNISYDPKSLNWSTNFINGKVKPFTPEYDSLEKRTFFIVEPIRNSFKESLICKSID